MKGCVAVLFCLLPVSAFAGQAPAPGQEPTVAQMIASAPQPGDSGVQATFGAQLQEGPTSTKGFSLSFVAAHTFENRNLARFDLDIARAYYKPSAAAPAFLKVEDNLKAESLFLHFFHKRWAAVGSAYYRRDKVIALDYRTFVDAGIGLQALDTPRAKLLVGVGYAVGREHRTFLHGAQTVRALGFWDSLVIKLTPTAQFEQSIRYQVDTSRSGEKSYDLDMSLTSRLSRHAALRVYYQRQYDTLHPTTMPKHQSEVGVGLSFTFQRPPRSTAKP